MSKYPNFPEFVPRPTPSELRAQLLPWLPRLHTESYFGYGLRAEELVAELRATRLPKSEWENYWKKKQGIDRNFKQDALEKCERLPFIIQNLVKNKIENATDEEAEAIIFDFFEKEHHNSTPCFNSYKSNEQKRIANAAICDFTEFDIARAADEKLKQMTSWAAAMDRISDWKLTKKWLTEWEFASALSLKQNNGEDCIEPAELDSYREKIQSKIDELPSELQLKKKLRKIKWRTNDEFANTAKLIGKGKKHVKTGSWNIKEIDAARERHAEFMANSVITNSSGEQISLSQIAKQTKKKRFAELYSMLTGIQKCAEKIGLDWCFAVLTAPPEFHPNPTSGGNKWNGSSPTDSHKFIMKKWKKVRDELENLGIYLAGFRSPEAHLDGCAHQNIFFYCHPDEMETVHSVIKSHFNWHEKAVKFKVNGDQKDGAAKATFASYCAKYALKLAMTDSLKGNPDAAWYSVNSIRKYQFFGVPSLTTWRALGHQKECPETENKNAISIWRAARRGDAAEFIERNGGLCVKQKDRQIQAKIEILDGLKTTTVKSWGRTICVKTRELWRIQTSRAARKPNKDGLSTVILKLPKESQTQIQTQKFNIAETQKSQIEPPLIS